jgi:hypothetical protein
VRSIKADDSRKKKSIRILVRVIGSPCHAGSTPLWIKLVRNGTLKGYEGFPHKKCTSHPDVID